MKKLTLMNALLVILVCAMCVLLASCTTMLEGVLGALQEATEQAGDVDAPAKPTPDPGTSPDTNAPPDPNSSTWPGETPTPDPNAEAEAQRLELSEQWKRAAFDGVQSYYEQLSSSASKKHDDFGRMWSGVSYRCAIFLYDAGFDAPYMIVVDSAHDVYIELSTLYAITNGQLREIVSDQWISAYENTTTCERDFISATFHSGGTYSETRYFKYRAGRWEQESYMYYTGGGQYFIDEKTGDYGEWEEAGRLLGERLRGYEEILEKNMHSISFDYATQDGRPIPWSPQHAQELSAFLDAYDGIICGIM